MNTNYWLSLLLWNKITQIKWLDGERYVTVLRPDTSSSQMTFQMNIQPRPPQSALGKKSLVQMGLRYFSKKWVSVHEVVCHADGEAFVFPAHCLSCPPNPLPAHFYVHLVGEFAPLPFTVPVEKTGCPLPLVLSCCKREVHPHSIMYQREDRAWERALTQTNAVSPLFSIYRHLAAHFWLNI